MRLVPILLLFILSACGGKAPSNMKIGETTKADLLAAKGEPEREEKVPVPGNSIMIYSDKETYQLENGVVKAAIVSPKENEKTLIFWKHKLKDCTTQLDKIVEQDSHTPAQMELRCDEQGIKVVYLEGSDVILKVVQYEKK